MRAAVILFVPLLVASCSAEPDRGNHASTPANTASANTVAAAAVPATAPEAAPVAPPEHRHGLFGGHLSWRKYEQITDGMSYQQVVDIIGREGNEMSSAGEGSDRSVVFSWENFSGSNAIITFQGDAVVAKAQSGLL